MPVRIPTKPDDVYSDELLCLGHGTALYEPDPGDMSRVHPGDVGYMSDGAFVAMFNVFENADHARNGGGVPADFVLAPEPARQLKTRVPLPPGPYYSETITRNSVDGNVSLQSGVQSLIGAGVDIHLTSESRRGAALMINRHAYREDTKCLPPLREYMLTHYRSWLQFAHEHHHQTDLRAVDILLVTGSDRTREWANISFNDNRRKIQLVFQASAPSFTSQIGFTHEQFVRSTIPLRYGPLPQSPGSENARLYLEDESTSSEDRYNQTVFIRTVRVKDRMFPGPSVVNDNGEVIHVGRKPTIYTFLTSVSQNSTRLSQSGGPGALSHTQTSNQAAGASRTTASVTDYDDMAIDVVHNTSDTPMEGAERADRARHTPVDSRTLEKVEMDVSNQVVADDYDDDGGDHYYGKHEQILDEMLRESGADVAILHDDDIPLTAMGTCTPRSDSNSTVQLLCAYMNKTEGVDVGNFSGHIFDAHTKIQYKRILPRNPLHGYEVMYPQMHTSNRTPFPSHEHESLLHSPELPQQPSALEHDGFKRSRAAPAAKTFQCQGYGDCCMVFSRSEHLARHIRKHTGERPFSCHCGKQFSRLDNLHQHAQTAHPDKQEFNDQIMRNVVNMATHHTTVPSLASGSHPQPAVPALHARPNITQGAVTSAASSPFAASQYSTNMSDTCD